MNGATIKDVASKAGVSIATVSYVLNGTRPVKPETRVRVQQAITDLHYVPNPAAQHLRGRRSKTIGFIVPTCATAFYISVLTACDRELLAQGYHTLIANSAGSLETERELIGTLSNGIVDGLIIFTACQNTEELQSMLPGNIPCVVLDIHFPSPVDSVTHSFSNAFQEVIPYYKQRGHQQIALFVGGDSLNSVQEHHRAYCRALESHGLPYDDELYFPSSRFRSKRKEVIDRLLARGCTALCFVDFNIMFDTFYDPGKGEFVFPPEVDVVCGSESPMDYTLLRTIPRIMTPTKEIGQIAAKQILFRLQETASQREPLLPQRTVIPCVVQYPGGVKPEM